MQANSQSRKYQLTINNPEKLDLDVDVVVDILKDRLTLDYFCISEEIGNEAHTRHIHVFIYSHSPIRFSTIKNVFPYAHIERANGSANENRDYVFKCGKWERTEKEETKVAGTQREFGDIPSESFEKEPLKSVLIKLVEEGLSTAQIIRENPKFAFNVKDIDALRETLLSEKYMQENRDVQVFYIFGETGTGKTRSIYEKHTPYDVCRVTSYHKDGVRFDSYHGQEVLVFEEYNANIPIQELLVYLDIYPVMLPARYSDRVACYTHVYILSNLELIEQYTQIQAKQPEVWNALIRRISHIYKQLDIGKQEEIDKEHLFI